MYPRDVELVREMIASAIEDQLSIRIVRTNMYYVSDPGKLATYGLVNEMTTALRYEVEYLRNRVARLERPWYKRWLRL